MFSLNGCFEKVKMRIRLKILPLFSTNHAYTLKLDVHQDWDLKYLDALFLGFSAPL